MFKYCFEHNSDSQDSKLAPYNISLRAMLYNEDSVTYSAQMHMQLTEGLLTLATHLVDLNPHQILKCR